MSPQLAGGTSFWNRYRWDRILTVGALLIGLVLVLLGLFGAESESDQPQLDTAESVSIGDTDPNATTPATVADTPVIEAVTADDAAVSPSGPASTNGPAARPIQQQGDLLDYAAAPAATNAIAGPEETPEAALYDEFPSPPAGGGFSEPASDDAGQTLEIAGETSDRVDQLAVAEPAPETDASAVAPAPRAAPVDRGPTDRGPTDRGPTDRGPTRDQRQPSGDRALTPLATEIISPDVSRFVITNAIKKREPVGSIGDIKEDRTVAGLVRVFAFSSVKNLSGQKVVYRWKRGEQVFAEISVAVGSNAWRSYSSKYLSNDMRGRWRVELVASSGQLLAYTEFDY